jgi:hypothetical protein
VDWPRDGDAKKRFNDWAIAELVERAPDAPAESLGVALTRNLRDGHGADSVRPFAGAVTEPLQRVVLKHAASRSTPSHDRAELIDFLLSEGSAAGWQRARRLWRRTVCAPSASSRSLSPLAWRTLPTPLASTGSWTRPGRSWMPARMWIWRSWPLPKERRGCWWRALLADAQQRDSSERQPVDLSRLVRDCVAVLAPEIERARARVELGRLPVVYGNAVLLSVVFRNPLGNAVEHGFGPGREIRVSAEPSNGA